MKRSELVKKHSNIRQDQMFKLLHHYLFGNKCCFSADTIASICFSNRDSIVEITKLAHEYNSAIKKLFHHSDNLSQIRSILLDFTINSEDSDSLRSQILRLNGHIPIGMKRLFDLGLAIVERMYFIDDRYQANRLKNNYTIEVEFDSEERPIGYKHVDLIDANRIDEEDIFYNLCLFMFDNHFEDLSVSISTTLQLEVA